ncbi:right-handed parallel beta-helix repeat-containing protein [Halorubrum sp. Eb13]|uniref:right-handed parallel beta-helix repeat-containing protein n=1 Tax=Halorubrum sp. Eb13 TaxID=1383843 RepID=UPI00113FE46A|nr:right-handed parallel beta-helix repeat-containing protein [Halorubrum sp. Eb13]
MTRPEYVPSDAEDITDHGAIRNPEDADDGKPSVNRDAIIDAANAAGRGGSIYVPGGTFYYGRNNANSWIRIGSDTPAGISLYGDGPEGSMLGITEHTPSGRVATMFRYSKDEYTSTAITVNIRGLCLDGNSPNLADDVTGLGIRVRSGNSGMTLNIENVKVYQITQSGVWKQDGSLNIDSCTFEHIAIKYENDQWDGSNTSIDHCIKPSPYASDSDSATITNSVFKTCSGSVVDPENGADGQITIKNCYCEGLGTGLAKLVGNPLTVTNTYAKMQSATLDGLLASYPDRDRPYDGRVAIYLFDVDPSSVTLKDCKFVDMTEQAMYTHDGRTWTISGDNVVFDNVGFRRGLQGSALRESGISNFKWDMDRLSVHNVDSSLAVIDTPNGGGTIQELTWSGGKRLGTMGSTTINSETQGGAPFEPNVPSQDEVGINISPKDNDDQPTTDSPLFDDWTPQWESDYEDWGVASSSAFAGDTALSFEHFGDTRDRRALSCNDVGEPTDVEILDKFRVPEFTNDSGLGFHARAHVRSSGSNGSENGYWLEVEKPSESFRLGKYTDGDGKTIARFGTPKEDTFYLRRFRAEGSELKAKVWPAVEEEPLNWDIETTDADHTQGWIGLGSYDTGLVETDMFSVATSGETAPRLNSGSSTEVTWKTPADGASVSGTVTVQIDVSNITEADSSLDVSYRIASGSWLSANYNPDTGYYEDSLDTARFSEGNYKLEARVSDSGNSIADAVIDIAVEKTVSIETVDARNISNSSATVIGELTNLSGVPSAICGFEWRKLGTESWNITEEQTLSSVGEFSEEISGLDSEIEYEFRAVAYEPEIVDAQTDTFYAQSSSEDEAQPVIEQFDLQNKSDPVWNRFDVDWAVSHAGGDLDTVVTKLRYDGSTVDAESTSITGDTASYTHLMRVRGPIDEVVLSVNDSENRITTESKSI